MASRTSIRSVPCPACGARPRQLCKATRGGTRQSNHLERVENYEKATGQKVYYAGRPKKVTPELEAHRQLVRDSVPCSACSARVGQMCQARRGDRQRNHAEREWAWRYMQQKAAV